MEDKYIEVTMEDFKSETYKVATSSNKSQWVVVYTGSKDNCNTIVQAYLKVGYQEFIDTSEPH